jgi:mRNA deadenylase 3'-5' endonuclease subunit Ccr4
MNKIAIITYNILSQNLAQLMIDDKIYPINIMNDEFRFNKIATYLKQSIIKYSKYNLIICLQEVCEDWLSKLSKLFNSIDYIYINIQHGRTDNGNMGILVAYPSKLQLVKSDFFNVGKHIKIIDENSKIAASKSNIAIFAIFEDPIINLKFGIITYHMPCVPTIEKVALLHCKSIYTHIIRFMSDIDWIFAGDFNMIPDTLAYKYMVDRLKLGCIYKDTIRYYPRTNHSMIFNKEFAGCIDYVFYRKGKISKKDSSMIRYIRRGLICDKIKLNKLTNIIPDKYEPSDHIPIIAIFNIKC